MGFVDRLRMNSLYPSTGIGPPDLTGGFDFDNEFGKMSNYLHDQDVNASNEATNRAFYGGLKSDRLRQLGEQINKPVSNNNGPVHVLAPPISPFQKGTLDIKNRELEQKGDIAEQGLEFKKNELASKTGINQGKLDVSKQRASIYDYKAKHPDLKFIATKGGNVIGFNPATGESIDTGIESGTLSDEDKQNLIGEQRIDQINHQGINQQQNINSTGSNQLANIAARAAGKNTGEKILLPGQVKTDKGNKARELINTRPDLAQHIEYDSTGNPINKAPAGSVEFNTINNALYPKGDVRLPVEKKDEKKVEITKPENNAPKAPAGWKYVAKPGGGWTAVEDKKGGD